jgi:ribA/ribD-fused uncharacterized protein
MTPETTAIYFYSTRGEHGCFSNFYRSPVMIDGKLWPTSEHYFQAMKFVGTALVGQVRRAPSPAEAARLGRSREHPLRPDWEQVKEEVMYRAVLAKFSQHADLRAVLLATGDAVLVEHTENDSYWGDGGDGTGKNRLGHILMRVREELRQSS